MAVILKNLIPAKVAENSQTTQYTASACKAILDKCTVTNPTAGAVPFSCNLVPLAGSASAANLIISAKSIAAGETYRCPELVGQVLEQGGFISTLAGSAAALTIRCSGREIT